MLLCDSSPAWQTSKTCRTVFSTREKRPSGVERSTCSLSYECAWISGALYSSVLLEPRAEEEPREVILGSGVESFECQEISYLGSWLLGYVICLFIYIYFGRK